MISKNPANFTLDIQNFLYFQNVHFSSNGNQVELDINRLRQIWIESKIMNPNLICLLNRLGFKIQIR